MVEKEILEIGFRKINLKEKAIYILNLSDNGSQSSSIEVIYSNDIFYCSFINEEEDSYMNYNKTSNNFNCDNITELEVKIEILCTLFNFKLPKQFYKKDT